MLLFKILIIASCFLFYSSFGALSSEDQGILVNWYNNLTSKGILSWNVKSDLCKQGVGCDNSKPNQRATTLNLNQKLISGTISPAFGNLAQLQTLSLSGNSLNGTIPTELGKLTQLQNLFLDGNKLTGTIPTELGKSTNLLQLYLYDNQLTGIIPNQILSLSKLVVLYLEPNYWDCPVANYSNFEYNDFDDAQNDCDESCSSVPCSNGGQCSTKLNGNYNCQCYPWSYGPNCENTINCPYIANQTNSEWNQTLANGQPINGKCLSGYQGSVSRSCILTGTNGNWSSISGSCDDINECETNNGGCDAHATCTNTLGSFTCSCNKWYRGDGFTCTVDCQQSGLRAIYFPVDDKGTREGNETFLERAENIDHFFDYIYPPVGSPHDKSQYGIQWRGNITFPKKETYKFYVYADDGVRIKMNDILVLDSYKPQILYTTFDYTPSIAGETLKFDVDYFQRTGNATIILHWSSPSTPKGPIPFEQFNYYECQDNTTPFGPSGCATIKLASYEYNTSTKKSKFCYEINVPSQHGIQCNLVPIKLNTNKCGSPVISGITSFVAGTKGQYCLQYNGQAQVVPTTTIDLSFPNQSITKTLTQTISGPSC